jgi:hypothetical protein
VANHRITVMGRAAEPPVVCGSAASIEKLAHQYGWEVKVGYSQYAEDGEVFKSGPRAGDRRPDRLIDTNWIEGIQRERRVAFRSSWEDGKHIFSKFGESRYIMDLVKINPLKKLIRGDIDE